jgi:arginine decarboxylase
MVWGRELARMIYSISGDIRSQYLDVDERGMLVVRIGGEELTLYDLLKNKDLPGAHIRILPIIRYMMDKVYGEFMNAYKKYGYRGRFYPVYPLKANSEEVVLDTIWSHGAKYNWGFNAGTYPEIKALEKYSGDNRLLVVDGVKDEDIIDLLEKMSGRWRVVVDIEGFRDAELLRDHGGLDVGLRIKVVVRSSGVWSHSSGLDSKFGLTITRLEKIIEKHEWVVNRAKLLHIHAGSQINNIEKVKALAWEAATIYNGLREMGFQIEYVDLGGGLAYPYSPSGEDYFSPNYTLREYADVIVRVFSEETDHPNLVFEGGRYIVAPHRITVAKIIDYRPYASEENISVEYGLVEEILASKNLYELNMYTRKAREVITRLLVNPPRNLESRRLLEKLYGSISKAITEKAYGLIMENGLETLYEITKTPNYVFEEITKPTHRFYTSFSIFSHIPDAIIVDQYFQVVPLQRLNEKPEVLGVISDLTCDSMGEYARFTTMIKSENIELKDLFTSKDHKLMAIPGKTLRLNAIPLHIPREKEEYYIAFLDTGAYQDMLSMKHNKLQEYPEIIMDIDKNGKIIIKYKNIEQRRNYPK